MTTTIPPANRARTLLPFSRVHAAPLLDLPLGHDRLVQDLIAGSEGTVLERGLRRSGAPARAAATTTTPTTVLGGDRLDGARRRHGPHWRDTPRWGHGRREDREGTCETPLV
jgi:hypothetical protein